MILAGNVFMMLRLLENFQQKPKAEAIQRLSATN